MNSQEEINDLFNRYINKQMSAKERMSFEAKLEEDSFLKEELEEYQAMIPFNKAKKRLEEEGFFEEALNRVYSPNSNSNSNLEPNVNPNPIPQAQKKIFPLKRFLAVAASILLIATSFFVIDNYLEKQQLVAASKSTLTKTKTSLLGQGAAPFDVAPIRQKKATTLSLEEQLHLNVEDIMAGKGEVAYNRLEGYRASSAYKSLEELDKVDIDWLTTLASFQTGNKTTTKELLKTVLQNPKYEKYAQDLLEQIE